MQWLPVRQGRFCLPLCRRWPSPSSRAFRHVCPRPPARRRARASLQLRRGPRLLYSHRFHPYGLRRADRQRLRRPTGPACPGRAGWRDGFRPVSHPRRPAHRSVGGAYSRGSRTRPSPSRPRAAPRHPSRSFPHQRESPARQSCRHRIARTHGSGPVPASHCARPARRHSDGTACPVTGPPPPRTARAGPSDRSAAPSIAHRHPEWRRRLHSGDHHLAGICRAHRHIQTRQSPAPRTPIGGRRQ